MTIRQNTWFSEFHGITSCEINGRPCENPATLLSSSLLLQIVEWYGSGLFVAVSVWLCTKRLLGDYVPWSQLPPVPVFRRARLDRRNLRNAHFCRYAVWSSAIVQFAITINSNVCPHIRVLNTLMRESYAWRHRNTLFPEHVRHLYSINYGYFLG